MRSVTCIGLSAPIEAMRTRNGRRGVTCVSRFQRSVLASTTRRAARSYTKKPRKPEVPAVATARRSPNR